MSGAYFNVPPGTPELTVTPPKVTPVSRTVTTQTTQGGTSVSTSSTSLVTPTPVTSDVPVFDNTVMPTTAQLTVTTSDRRKAIPEPPEQAYSVSCAVEIYTYENGNYTLQPGNEAILAVSVNKSIINGVPGQFAIEMAPGGVHGTEDLPTWSQMITPGSLVLIGMQRGNRSQHCHGRGCHQRQ